MAIDMFLILQSPAVPSTPVAGEATMDAYYKTFAPTTAVEIRSFSLGVENIITIGSATGGMGAGKIKLKEAYIEKSVDLLTPSLYKVSASGAHFDKMQLFIRKTGGAAPVPRPYLMYGFSIVYITSIDWSAGEGDEVPAERVTFAYGRLAISYYPQKPDGTFGTKKTATWDQIMNQEPVPPEVLANF